MKVTLKTEGEKQRSFFTTSTTYQVPYGRYLSIKTDDISPFEAIQSIDYVANLCKGVDQSRGIRRS